MNRTQLEQNAALSAQDGNSVAVGIADIKLGRSPQVIKTTLGSCVAVCLYNSKQRCGGMLHFMMAVPLPGDMMRENMRKAKYAQTGIPELLRQLKAAFGLSPEQFQAKFFGGANLLSSVSRNIGKINEEAVRAILREHGVKISASLTGGNKGYKIDMDMATGRVRCQIFGEEAREF